MLTEPMATILLVHPPLLAPAVFEPVARVLRDQGHRVVVPDYSAALQTAPGWWDRARDLCRSAVGAGGGLDIDVVVGYSGSGVVIPLIADAIEPSRSVFVDAVLPDHDRCVPSEQIRELAAALLAEHDGERLPPWTRWWPRTAYPVDDVALAELDRSCPRLPADFYDHAVPVPAGWEPGEVRYLQLSAAYADAAAGARKRGWEVSSMDADHLAVLSRPTEVAAAVVG